jgi:glycine hydroxymethyltransferase
MNPGGVRLGSPALTSRGFKEADFVKVADFLHRGVQIGLDLQAKSGKKLVDFTPHLEGNAELALLRRDVEEFADAFPMPGNGSEVLEFVRALA